MKVERTLITGFILFSTGVISLQLLMFKPFGCLYGKTADGCAAAELDLGITIVLACLMIIGWSFLIAGIVHLSKKYRELITGNFKHEKCGIKYKSLTAGAVLGASLATLGFIGFEIVLFKPWASCDYGDTSTECAATELESLLLSGFFCSLLVGVLVSICSFSYWLITSKRI